jgi:hypothetical protein
LVGGKLEMKDYYFGHEKMIYVPLSDEVWSECTKFHEYCNNYICCGREESD